MKNATTIIITIGDEGYMIEVNKWNWASRKYEESLYFCEDPESLFDRLVRDLCLRNEIEVQAKVKEE